MTVPLIILSLVAVAEAIAFHLRYAAAARGGRNRNAGLTAIVASLRVVFILVGVQAVMQSVPWWSLIVAYTLPATVATWLVAGSKE